MKLLVLFTLFFHFSSLSADISQGETLYKKCISCHGNDGLGKKSQKAPMIAGQYDWYVKSQIIAIQKQQRDNANAKKMYPFVKNLKTEEIENLAAFISQMAKRK